MSTLHINQIANKMKALFEDKLQLDDISPTDKERDVKILSRCLAAYAIYYFSQCSIEEAALSVVDAADDNGIDGIYYSEKLKKLFIVQSKWSKNGKGEPSRGDLLKFNQGIKDLFDLNFDKFNDKIKQRSSTISSAFDAYDTKFEIILIDTYENSSMVNENLRPIEDFIIEMNNNGDDDAERLINFSRMNQSEIHTSIRQENQEQLNIEMGLSNWGVISTDLTTDNQEIFSCKAYYGSISANEISDWWIKFKDKIFEKNIRKVLGRTDVNEEIENTLKDNPDLFWYLNNGITVIADKISKTAVGGNSRDIGTFKLENFSVINGAQTISSIGRFKEFHPDHDLSCVSINIRIIEISDNLHFAKLITRANNRQNRIDGMDFASQDPEQLRIKNELILEDVEYSIMRSDTFKSTDKSFNLQEATVSLASINKNVVLAVQVKSAIGKFFENLERGIYKEIFNPNISGYYVYNSVLFNRAVNKILTNKTNNIKKKTGKLYGILVHGNRMIANLLAKKMNIHNQLSSNNFNIDEMTLEAEATKLISDINDFIEENYPDNFLATFFKNSTKCKHLAEEMLSKP